MVSFEESARSGKVSWPSGFYNNEDNDPDLTRVGGIAGLEYWWKGF